MNYSGQKCVVCGEVFDNNSDVVVCPECGAPHHRECYSSLGHCAHADKHASGYVWNAEKNERTGQPENSAVNENSQGVVCPVCGNINLYGSSFCSRCGTRLENQNSGNSDELNQNPYQDGFYTNRQDGTPQTARPLYGAGNRPETEFQAEQYAFDGIDGKHWKKYIGKSVPFYFSAFTIMDQTKRKASFSWAAGLFPYAYFAYRRVWWAAVLAVLLNIILAVPSSIIALTEMGISSITMTESLLVFLSYASTVCSIINFAFKILCAIFGFWIYRKNASRKLTEALNENRPYPSGPSIWGLVVVLVLLVVINGAVSMKLMDVSAYMKILGIGTV